MPADETRLVLTQRLEIRPPVESDRQRFVSLFGDAAFMVFSAGVLTPDAANARFDSMLERAEIVEFAKQPIVERSTGMIVGYAGVDAFSFEGQQRWEFGWRLVPEARGRGIATEAVEALLDVADRSFHGELLAMIDPRNTPSHRVAHKVGFRFWKEAVVNGFLDHLYRLPIPRAR